MVAILVIITSIFQARCLPGQNSLFSRFFFKTELSR
jgi:hypothetical protein